MRRSFSALVLIAALVTAALWSDKAVSLESPLRSPLVVPAGDCPSLPAVYRNNRQFDSLFRKATLKHWPAPIENNWCWLKAQCAAESSLKPRVTSPAGAKGLCQFLDATLAETGARIHRKLNPYDARDSVEAAAVYVYQLRQQWTSPRPEHEAFRLAWASYNAGLGSILRAQAVAHGAALWRDIHRVLSAVTGRHAKETIGYVARISRFTGLPPHPTQPPYNAPLPPTKPALGVCLP